MALCRAHVRSLNSAQSCAQRCAHVPCAMHCVVPCVVRCVCVVCAVCVQCIDIKSTHSVEFVCRIILSSGF